ncbi:hypothetical protein QEH56_21110 [Pelagicoccus enzymogenes]|uniref:endonuclease/exonuclease/phosphatase family protein n=1 Tax=Pelagicoccus enzymogenes TaxID=2773457 RepID=UPI0028106015|nr:endonuclease/exonuclease/phosphatase family protein [Pelagicoccus enzymogenes]MDQ8200680.1 hypothetical protein [Pelagicoccus enzymogenes]
MKTHTLLAAFCCLVSTCVGTTLEIVGWNLESGESDINLLDDFAASSDGIDIWGLSEVQSYDVAEQFALAAGDGESGSFDVVFGSTGGSDRLAIVFDESRFTLVDHFELHDINTTGRVRAPLVARFSDGESGIEFMVMVNHLYRGREDQRHLQAEMLNEWVGSQVVPVVAVGDYNFDWDVSENGNSRDRGFDLMTAGGAWAWIKPDPVEVTHLSNRYDSILDFVFVSGNALGWSAVSSVMKPYGGPDDDFKSDHLPVFASFEMSAVKANSKELILDRIETLETELAELKALVQSM